MKDSMVEEVREAARGVVEEYPRSYMLECAREGRFPQEMWDALGTQGLLGLGVPEALGGIGGGVQAMVALCEAMTSVGTTSAFFAITSFSRLPIIKYGTVQQCEKFVKPTITGDAKICFALTEPDAGTNSFAIKSRATRTDSGWALSGQKAFITGAKMADYMLVIARTESAEAAANRTQGLSLFVISTKSPGIEYQPMPIDAVAGDTQYSVFFDNVQIGEEALIGEEGRGVKYLFDGLNPERMITAIQAVGFGSYALDKGVAYAKERAPFGQSIGSYQGIQHPMARAKARLEAARLMVYDCARRFDEGESIGATANMAKLLATEAADEALDIAIQAHGGSAFDASNDVHTLWQHIRLLRIIPINNEMVLNHIAEHVLGLPKSY